MKNKIRIGLIVFALALIIVNLTLIDYSNLTWSWSMNLSPFIQIGVGILLIISSILQIRQDKKQQANLTDKRR